MDFMTVCTDALPLLGFFRSVEPLPSPLHPLEPPLDELFRLVTGLVPTAVGALLNDELELAVAAGAVVGVPNVGVATGAGVAAGVAGVGVAAGTGATPGRVALLVPGLAVAEYAGTVPV